MESLIFQRGDIVICVLSRDYGKPRPAVVVQSDLYNPTHASVTLCPLISHLIEAPLFCLSVKDNARNGLDSDSQVMVDKMVSVKSEKVRDRIGAIAPADLAHLDEALRRWLALA